MAKTLFEIITEAYPELLDNRDLFINGTITLRDDSDGLGAYIDVWNYAKALPAGLKVGK
jgi:hypothetical protein